MRPLLITLLLAISTLTASAQQKPSFIPQPDDIAWMEGSFLVNKKTSISTESATLRPAAEYLSYILVKATGYEPRLKKRGGTIHLALSDQMAAGSYMLNVTPKLITLTGADYQGIVSGIKSINPEKYERAQYYIKTSLDAEDSLYVYNGYYVDGAAFTDAEQLQVGDEVIICGVLTIYKETPEFDANNYIYSLKREGEEEPTERITIGDITDLIERYLEQEQ